MKKGKSEKFDVAVIGAGAAGSVAAEQLCSMGYKVALLDAGSSDGTQKASSTPWKQKLRIDYHVQKRSEVFTPQNEHYFVKDTENPYSFSPNHPFFWIRSRSLGGRMNLWTGECYRMSDLDFKASSRDGAGIDWPLTLEELSPHYEKAEDVLKIWGHKNGIHTIPDGRLIRAPSFNGNEKFVQERLGSRGIPVVLDRLARESTGRAPNLHKLIHYAQKSGNLTYFPGFVAKTLKRSRNGLIESVEGVSLKRKLPISVNASAFFVCASTLESTRIVMNSQLKNIRSQKILGRYLNDHIGGPKSLFVQGYFPTREADMSLPERLLYVPRYQNLGTERTYPFKRGFGMRVCLKRLNPFLMGFAITAFGEALPYESNGVELQQKFDNWKAPTLRVKFRLRENENKMFEYMKWELQQVANSLTEEGGKIVHTYFNRKTAGLCNHEVGTLRMGADPEQSFLNSFCRSHDIENLYVTDGASFPSLGTANPTLTLMALTYRACADLAEKV